MDPSEDLADTASTSHSSKHSSHSSKHSSHSSKHSSHSSKYSSQSSRSLLLEKKSKAEGAKAGLQIIEEQESLKRQLNELELKAQEEKAISRARLQKQRADYESTLTILKQRRRVLEAEAELSVIEELSKEGTSRGSSETQSLESLPKMTSADIVKNYVDKGITSVQNPDVEHQTYQERSTKTPVLDPHVKEFVPKGAVKASTNDTFDINQNYNTLNQHESPMKVGSYENPPVTHIGELSKYIIKKDILLSRFVEFDDRPERYVSWRNSFRNITQDLETTSYEELDLLQRYLGPQSKKQATSLRVAHAHNERQALCKIWQRLDERYGAPEKVACSLQERLDKFPKITNSETDKLYELADLLTEILAVKENPQYNMILASYDSSTVVNAILAKVPTHIQNKWIDQASTLLDKKMTEKTSVSHFSTVTVIL